jgi:hypothetical protein
MTFHLASFAMGILCGMGLLAIGFVAIAFTERDNGNG